VESVDCAVAAERGGAHRIELCSELAVGGLTPNPELMRATRDRVRLPVYAMIRPRAGSFCYSEQEFASMLREVSAAKRSGMDGIVVGLLDSQKQIDVERTKELVDVAQPLPVTFHRAFDEAVDLEVGLESVIEAGAKRILTSGGSEHAVSGLPVLGRLVRRASGRIIIMPGGGINTENVGKIMRLTSAREVHSSLGGAEMPASDQCAHRRSATHIDGGSGNGLEEFEEKVRKLASVIARAAENDLLL
jgi:copper homeostasis protein